ncbi:MAG: hypothetical protein ACYCU7_03670 [Acidimicrobiales bacterium]
MSPSSGAYFGHSTAPLVSPALGIGGAAVLAILIGLLALVVALTGIGVFVIVVVANRADPDPSGRRPMSVYLFAISFVSLFATVGGLVAVVASLVELIGGHGVADQVARGVLLGGLVAVVSLAVLVVHLGRGLAFARVDPTGGPSQRVARSYVAAVAFAAVLLLIVATIAVVYLVVDINAPGVFGIGGTDEAARLLVVAAWLDLIALAILVTHRNLVSPGLRFGRRPVVPPPPPAPPPPGASAPLPAPPAPPSPPPAPPAF